MPEAHSSTAIDQHPPKPRLVLRVGVTGHRGEHLKEYDVAATRTSVAKVLTIIRDVVGHIHQDERAMFVAAPPLLRVLSRLADGAALIVAEKAVQQGFELQCVLPFPRAEYANYIDSGWRSIYDRMLAAASTVLELDLDRQQPEEAFLHGRRMVLHHTDLLIAIWDPKRPRKEWGTSRILNEAGRDDILTVHVPPTAPNEGHLDIRGASREICSVSFTELEARLRQLLCPPQPDPPPNRCERLRRFFDPPLTQKDYFAERQREWRQGFVWKLFCDTVEKLKPSWPQFVQRGVLEQTRQDWREEWAAEPTIPEPVRRQADHFLRDHFVWADTLADYYADLTRSSFVLNPLMAAAAVGCALAAYALDWTAESHSLHGLAWIWIAAELGLILAIVALTLFGNRRD